MDSKLITTQLQKADKIKVNSDIWGVAINVGLHQWTVHVKTYSYTANYN